jgi:large conductance mechanosensitive channel
MKKMLNELKTFAVKGNVLDMAIGIIVGTAFNAIVSSMVADIVTPLLSLIVGEVEFKNLAIILVEATDDKAAITLKYGVFLQKIFDFIIIALVAFGVIKGMNNLKTKSEDVKETKVATPKDIQLLTEIRDALVEQKSMEQNK